MNTWLEARVQRARIDDLRREAELWRMVHRPEAPARRGTVTVRLGLAQLRRIAGWRLPQSQPSVGLSK